MLSASTLKKTFTLQHDQADCGVACMLSIMKYHGGTYSLEKLREFSGTNSIGTTLLGLYQCAKKLGFEAGAFEATIESLKTIEKPCILHVIIDKNLHHYVICYGTDPKKNGGYFLIGDPAKGIVSISAEELSAIWQSRAMLQLEPNTQFVSIKEQRKIKWEWFLKLLKDDITILIVTMVLGVIITVLGLAMAVFSQKLIDNILPSHSAKKLITGLVLLFMVLLIRAGLSYIRQFFLLMQSKDFNNRIVGSFFSSLVVLPKSFFDRRKTGDMITRMNDTSRIQRNIAYITGSVFIDSIILITTCVFLINYSLMIALIVFGFIPVLVFTVLSYSKPIKVKQRQVMVSNALNESNYIDTIQGISVVKSYNKENYFIGLVSKVYGVLQNETMELGKISNNFTLTTDLLSVVLNLVLISVASFLVLNNELKTGEMIAIISLVSSLMPAVARLSQINVQLQEANIAFDRMYDFTSVEQEYNAEEKKDVKLDFEELEIKNIAFRFPGRRAILKDISFAVSKGEIISLLGESGSGKSTMISILQKFYSPDVGTIKLNGFDLGNINTHSWRNVIATVPQEIKLFNGSVIENISIGCQPDEVSAVIDFCKNLGFNHFFEEFPQGYFTLIGEEGINLSGGQKQLIALARALYTKPQLLLLDEATSAMDRNTEKFILNILQRLKHQMGIVLITHRVQTAKITDRVYIIENGMIQDSGTPLMLLNRQNFYSELFADAVM